MLISVLQEIKTQEKEALLIGLHLFPSMWLSRSFSTLPTPVHLSSALTLLLYDGLCEEQCMQWGWGCLAWLGSLCQGVSVPPHWWSSCFSVPMVPALGLGPGHAWGSIQQTHAPPRHLAW